jgi:methylenetetrahydrofolate reductase (NADPH)
MRIDQLLENAAEPCFSVEFFPPKSEEGRTALFETVEVLKQFQPGFFSVTYGAGGATREGTVEMTEAIRRDHGVETMAHLSCVGERAEGLLEILDRLTAVGIENVLALRGDPPRGQDDFVQPEGGLRSAAELAALISERYPQVSIGGTCFPEVHPEAANLEADLAYLRTKVESGARFLISQLFFDNRVFFEFREAAREAGIDVPIIPGVIPVASYGQVKRICALCSASIPAPLAEAMEAAGGDEEAEFNLGVAYASQQCAELLRAGVPGIHFYALNRAPATRAVLGALHAAQPWQPAEAPAGSAAAG